MWQGRVKSVSAKNKIGGSSGDDRAGGGRRRHVAARARVVCLLLIEAAERAGTWCPGPSRSYRRAKKNGEGDVPAHRHSCVTDTATPSRGPGAVAAPGPDRQVSFRHGTVIGSWLSFCGHWMDPIRSDPIQPGYHQIITKRNAGCVLMTNPWWSSSTLNCKREDPCSCLLGMQAAKLLLAEHMHTERTTSFRVQTSLSLSNFTA